LIYIAVGESSSRDSNKPGSMPIIEDVMFTAVSVKLFSFNFGPSVTAIGKLGPGSDSISEKQARKLFVPWQRLLPDQDLFSLLSWHTRLSEFAGREKEMGELRLWAESDYPVRVKFVVAEGGVGKSRLGAEFSEQMKRKGWAAGFVNLRKANAFPMKRAGTLIVIDYPEEHIESVTELLKDLTTLGIDCKVRVLFLTRQSPSEWGERVSAANADNIVEKSYLALRRLSAKEAKTIYDSIARKAGEELERRSGSNIGPGPIPVEAMEEWLKNAPENERALFIMAAAIHSAEEPAEEQVEYTGREVVRALVKREVDRYYRIAESRGYKDRFCLARLLAMAAIAGELTTQDIETIVNKGSVQLESDTAPSISDELAATGMLTDGEILAPTPDIVAAALTVDVLGRPRENAPEIVWTALQGNIAGCLERVARLCYDAEIVLGIHAPRISDWLAQCLYNRTDRCRAVEHILISQHTPVGWLSGARAVCETLIQHAVNNPDKVRYLNNLSVNLVGAGKTREALAHLRKAVEILRHLAEHDHALWEPELATGMNNLSNLLHDCGLAAEALPLIHEAVAIRRRLAKDNPVRFEPDLALSLNNLSINLSATGDIHGAMAAILESVDIRRRSAKDKSTCSEAYLAASLNTLSSRLYAADDAKGALSPIEESVEIYRRLNDSCPARFEPNLATGLNNLSNILLDCDKKKEALLCIREAVEILRRLAAHNPARFEPDLALSLDTLSGCFSAIGDTAKALPPMQEAVDLRRRCAASNAVRFEPELASSLNNLSACLKENGRGGDALPPLQEAVSIYRRLVKNRPVRFEPELADCFNNLSTCLDSVGSTALALSPLREAVKIYRRLVTDNLARFGPALASCLIRLSKRMQASGDTADILPLVQETVDTYRRLAEGEPDHFDSDLASNLIHLSDLLNARGDTAGALVPALEAVVSCRRLVERDAARFKPALARGLGAVALLYFRLGQHDNAQSALDEAVLTIRPYSQNSPGSPHERLLKSLEKLQLKINGAQ
jgi:tetratricopeptide (TPR) repeat protein